MKVQIFSQKKKQEIKGVVKLKIRSVILPYFVKQNTVWKTKFSQGRKDLTMIEYLSAFRSSVKLLNLEVMPTFQ